ncbi:MAG: hypothetical protein J4F35_05605 [Candidatus Latescibacteria bacterium]|nr:hypothetical protein [Candidatus Latescibacterota bacterium]
MTLKEKLHRLVDELPEKECHAAERYLEYLRDQGDLLLHRLASVPYDDEPETQEERRAVEEAYEDLHTGRTHSLEDVKREIKKL